MSLKAEDSESGDHFGWAVAVSGSEVAVGAPKERLSAGKVYVFSLRLQPGEGADDQVTQPLRNRGDMFGIALSFEGGLLAVGASSEDYCPDCGPRSNYAGAVYVFARGARDVESTPDALCAAHARLHDSLETCHGLNRDGLSCVFYKPDTSCPAGQCSSCSEFCTLRGTVCESSVYMEAITGCRASSYVPCDRRDAWACECGVPFGSVPLTNSCDLVTQYATGAEATSAYGGSWAVEEALGPPAYEEGSCLSRVQGSWAPSGQDRGTHQLTLSFATPVRVSEVRVREHANPPSAAGFLQRVEVEVGGGWERVWEGEDNTACGFDKVIELDPPSAETRRVRLTTQTEAAGWEYVDSVRVRGRACAAPDRWGLSHYVKAPDVMQGLHFGYAVALRSGGAGEQDDGAALAVGAFGEASCARGVSSSPSAVNGSRCPRSGAAYVFMPAPPEPPALPPSPPPPSPLPRFPLEVDGRLPQPSSTESASPRTRGEANSASCETCGAPCRPLPFREARYRDRDAHVSARRNPLSSRLALLEAAVGGGALAGASHLGTECRGGGETSGPAGAGQAVGALGPARGRWGVLNLPRPFRSVADGYPPRVRARLPLGVH